MTTRRNFIRGGAAAATGVVFCSCGLLEHARAQGASSRTLPVAVNGKKVRTIDVHAHCYFHDVEPLVGPDIARRFLPPVNGAANAAPTYTFLNGQGTSKITAEYQLCFKCHSGSTILLGNPQAGAVPYPYSLDNLDKGKELNPANASFHPIEAAGTNQTDAMKNSLTGSSTYRIFTFPTEISSGVAPTMRTVRCTNCHTSGSIGASGTTFGGSQPTHASANRGLLIAQYVDRTLLKTGVAYNSGNFALCFGCHAEAAFNSGFTSSDTNFSPHFKHVAGISGSGGGGLSIDTPGDGQGNALCAECHFRLHSTTFAVGTPSYSRLVNFAPDVLPFKGKLEWTSTSVGHGTCTLTCHGHDHDAQGY